MQTIYRTLYCAFSLLPLMWPAVGCSKGPTLPTVPVSGSVTLDGKPLEGAAVSFTPVPSNPDGKPANGITDAQGTFQLKTYLGGTTGQASGAMPGDYVVMVTKYEASSGPAPAGAAEGHMDTAAQQKALQEAQQSGKPMELAIAGQTKLTTPQKYANPKDTDLKATVQGSGNQPFTFDLKSS